jgi:hypothetical protein
LKADESQKGVEASRPPVLPDEEWLRKFDAPHSSAASINADPKLLDEKEIEAEAQLRMQARLQGAPPPERLPAVTAGNVFKLPGSASGEAACHAVREKAIEGRVDELLKEHRKGDRDSKKEEKADGQYSVAIEGLDLLSTSGLGALKVDHLKGILTVHTKEVPKGKKDDLQEQLRSLLKEKTPEGTDQAAVIAEMKRLTAAAAAARQVNDRPLEPLGPPQEEDAAPLLLQGPLA